LRIDREGADLFTWTRAAGSALTTALGKLQGKHAGQGNAEMNLGCRRHSAAEDQALLMQRASSAVWQKKAVHGRWRWAAAPRE
jgi:hypothetical protein